MFDESSLQQNQTFNLTIAFQSYLLLAFAVMYCMYLQLCLSTKTFSQVSPHLFLLTGVLLLILLTESYQFYYTVTKFNEIT